MTEKDIKYINTRKYAKKMLQVNGCSYAIYGLYYEDEKYIVENISDIRYCNTYQDYKAAIQKLCVTYAKLNIVAIPMSVER